MIVRRIATILFLPMMFAFGSGVYIYLGTLKSKVVKERAQLPTVTKQKFILPGTMFVVQEGRLFKLNGGSFSEIGPAGNWSQPTLTPDHTRVIAVLRSGFYSDLYLLDLNGHIVKRLTKDDSRIIDANHWALYPRVSPDGTTLFYGFDSPKANGVDLSIWSMPLTGLQRQARRWTDPLWYTGGDISPISLAAGGVLFVRHSIDPSTAVHSQIEYQSRALAIAKPLTTLADNCSQPALSPDGTQLAMICTGGSRPRGSRSPRLPARAWARPRCSWRAACTRHLPGRPTARHWPISPRPARPAISSCGTSRCRSPPPHRTPPQSHHRLALRHLRWSPPPPPRLRRSRCK